MRAPVIDHIRAHAEQRPDHPALIVAGRGGERTRCSYAELVRSFEAHAARLQSVGLREGDRCGLVARQGRGFVEAALGILAADLCLVPIPDGTEGPALEEAAAQSSLHQLLTEASGFAPRLMQNLEPVDGQGDDAFRALRPAYLRFTSGTTHERKGVTIGHEAILERLHHANRGLQIGPEDRILWVLPMAHHFVVSILLYLRYGATVLLPASTLARSALELAVAERASVLYASPYHYGLLAKDSSDLELRSVRLAISTADGLRAEIAQRFGERFGLPLVQALGIIEVGLPVINLHAPAQKPTALGRPLPDYEVWLRDEDGKPIEGPSSPQRTGEICIRGSGLFDAYLRPWVPAAELVEPDGFRTGDQGWFDADGDLFLAGRRSNRISMAGMKFFAEEVEAVLQAHASVRECRVRAQEHEQLGEIPVAEIVPVDAAAPPAKSELVAHCRESLAPYKIPREFAVVKELPHTATGKLRRWVHSRA